MADFDRTQDPRSPVELRSAIAELFVLRKALEVARDEARSANVSASRAETALARQRASMEKALARERTRTADAKRLRQEWRESAEKWRKEYDRVTSTWLWRLYSPFDRALHRARSLLRRRERHLDLSRESGRGSDYGRERRSNAKEDAVKPSSVETVGVGELETEAKSKPKPPVVSGGVSTALSPTYQVPDLSSLSAITPRGRIAVVLHLYYPELWPEFRDALGAIPEPADLFVTLTVGYSDQAGDWIRIDYPSAQIITFENRGRDILPFVTLINSGLLFRYELICKLHTKRSMHIDHGDDWRCALLGGVLSNDHVPRILTAFNTDPDLGIVVADGSLRDDARSWSKHLGRVGELSNRIGMPAVTAESGYPKFPAGSIFWVRSSLLRPIACLRLTPAEFEPEPIPPNACMPHAIERLFGHICREAGMRVAESSDFK